MKDGIIVKEPIYGCLEVLVLPSWWILQQEEKKPVTEERKAA